MLPKISLMRYLRSELIEVWTEGVTMLYRIHDTTVFLGGEEILSHFDFEIKGREKIAVTGRNGAGKTTLLKLIAGELAPERDDKRIGPAIEKARELSIAYLKQTCAEDSGKTVDELIMEACPAGESFESGALLYEVEYLKLLTGFGLPLEGRRKCLSEFSGGEQTKISLIRLLLEKPDILLLDEPTNNLDIATVEWLEEYLRSYPAAVVFVSHDRFFMDRVADVVYEIDRHRVTRYPGNYTAFRQQKLENIRLAMRAREREEAEIKRLEELIVRFRNKPKKAAFARSRQSILNRMERTEVPAADAAHIFTGEIVPEDIGAKTVLDAEHLKCGYVSGAAAVTLSVKLKRGDHVAITGANGTGKSAFVRTVAGRLKALDGKCSLGNRVSIGYFDQDSAMISSEKTVLEYFKDSFPAMDDKTLRGTLADYLFRGADTAKKVAELSGGEKSRLVLAVILTQKPNFLILDEPTNHMDIEAVETLESAFTAYKGTILFVSHDRYFVNKVADSFYIFEDGRALYYPFDYAHYLERLERLKTAGRPVSGEEAKEGIMGLMSAEDAALVAGLKAVPERERHEIRLGTEEEAGEWRKKLAEEALARIEEEYYAEWTPEAEEKWTEACIRMYLQSDCEQ